MTKPLTDLPMRKRPLLTPYAIMWSMLGTLGLGYLGVAIFAPDVLEELTPPSRLVERQRAETEASMLRVSTDVNGLRSSYAQLQLDLAKVKGDVNAGAGQSSSFETRIATLEDQVRQLQTQAPAAPSEQAPPAKVSELDTPDEITAADPKSLSKAPPAPDKTKTAAVVDKKPKSQSPKIINSTAKNDGAIETGSVNAKKSAANAGDDGKKDGKDGVISFGPAVVKPAAKPVGIRVASGSSVDGLRLSWSLLSENHDALKTLKPRYVDSGDAINPSFDLVAGPVKTKAEAQRLCKKLTAQNVPCTVGDFKGEDL